MRRGGACIVKDGLGVRVDSEELLQLGFKLRNGTNLEPDILVTVGGRPHAFLLLDERRLGARADGVGAEVSARLASLQKGFRQVYLLAPASYGHRLTAEIAARNPDVTVVTFSDTQDTVGAAVRLVDALSGGAEGGGLDAAEIDAQRLAAVVDEGAVSATLQTAEEASIS